jgi:hypothetical protein
MLTSELFSQCPVRSKALAKGIVWLRKHRDMVVSWADDLKIDRSKVEAAIRLDLTSESEAIYPADPNRFVGQCVAVTSLNPNRARRARQLDCLLSWKQIGLPIISVNTAVERNLLSDFEELATFSICENVTTNYDRQTQFINSLLDVGVASGLPFFLINSDIEISGDPAIISAAIADPQTLTIGVRHNHTRSNSLSSALREPAGVDVFGMTPEMARTIPRMPFGLGKPVWDYWVPLHFRDTHKFQWIREPFFFHEQHRIGWSQADWDRGAAWLSEYYKINDVANLRQTFREPQV